MTPQLWNPDEATVLTLDDPDLGRPARYGETGWESAHQEPLDLALAQEIPDTAVAVDEQWAEVDLDEFELALVGRASADAPEELAMHLVEI